MSKQTWIGLVRKHFSLITDTDAEMILWEATCFPMCSAEKVEQQLIEAYQKSGGSVNVALGQAYAEMDRSRDEARCKQAKGSK